MLECNKLHSKLFPLYVHFERSMGMVTTSPEYVTLDTSKLTKINILQFIKPLGFMYILQFHDLINLIKYATKP
ncbi:hypothetical protein VDIAB_110436 [Vibrio diabolicus]|nr:hypothetical protein VDIAB_110436 [Vibrio diabolicus]